MSPGYFRTMAIPLLQGRDLDERDTADATPVAVVNASFAGATWPGQDPLGRRIRFDGAGPWRTVVGVVGDVKHGRFADAPMPQAYTPHDRGSGGKAQLFASVCGGLRASGSMGRPKKYPCA